MEAVAGLDRVWVSDITYLPTRAGWLYLAVVLSVLHPRVALRALVPGLARRWNGRPEGVPNG